MSHIQSLLEHIRQHIGDKILQTTVALDELTLTLSPKHLRDICFMLREDPFKFDILIDVCGVDYLSYGRTEWETYTTTLTGFSRAVEKKPEKVLDFKHPRFAALYHLLSIANNQRIRLKVFCETDPPSVDSVVDIWPAANWFEREAFDLYGIVFKGHPDLRRILTDYGFLGHPFRKDFPLIGEVEMRYDATKQRCVYEPVSIQPRTLVPKVIREDHGRFKPEVLEEGKIHE